MKRLALLVILVALVACVVLFRSRLLAALQKTKGTRTVAERVEQFGSQARGRLKPWFERARVAYPPKQLSLVGLKLERSLEIHAADDGGQLRFIRSYPILAASGGPGPKLKEGDRQVPEGIYPIESLNPNSRFHLALRVGYPNAFDRERAAKDGRTKLGGDIMIHGRDVSIGCLAMGDEAAEDLFVLAADTGLTNMTVILSPLDFRKGKPVPNPEKLPAWTAGLYENIRARLGELKNDR